MTDGEDYSLTFASAVVFEEIAEGIPVPVQRERLVRVHGPDRCEGRFCCIHNPSPHHMREWRLSIRFDRGIAERLCPHGIGHPDPDDAAYRRTLPGEYDEGIHGCDGCCARRHDGPG